MAFEHEIKLRVGSLDVVRARLRDTAAGLRQAATFEDNWVLDDDARRIGAAGCLLRVRRWGEAAVTLELLAALGFTPWRRYQKRREVWELHGVAVALDETPMGCFVELEGVPESIGIAAKELGLQPGDAVSGTYLHLWEEFRAAHPEAPADMVFS